MTGLTAYAGLTRVAGLKEGDVVFVSGAAGAVGSVVGQIAKALGASRVIGSAGSQEKVDHLLDDLGFDAAFNYKDGRVSDLLREAAPDGIDVYFDNVGGDHLEAAIGSLRLGGRIAICGAISVYNNTEAAPGPAQPRAPHPDARHHPGLPRRRPLGPRRRVRPARGRLDRRRHADLARDVQRRHRPRGRRLPRRPARRERRQDARPPLTDRESDPSDAATRTAVAPTLFVQVPSRSLALSAGSRSWRSGSRTNDPVPCDTDRRSIG